MEPVSMQEQFSNMQVAPDAAPKTDGAQDAPDGAKKPAGKLSVFQTTRKEKILAWVLIPIAYCYACFMINPFETSSAAVPAWMAGTILVTPEFFLSLFTVGFMIAGEILHWKERRSVESVVWLCSEIVVMAVILFGALPFKIWSEPYFPGTSPWEKWHLALFLHLFGVYWLLVRGNRLSEGKTSHMFVWDGITGFFVLPFKNIYRQVTTIISCFIPKEPAVKEPGKKKALDSLKVIFSALAVLIGIILLGLALTALSRADQNFANVLDQIGEFLHFQIDGMFVLRVIVALHVSAYAFALLDGSFIEEKERFENRGNLVKQGLELMKKVPYGVWVGLIAVFSVFYVIFFVIQGSYLFGAFEGTLPAGFTFSTYAREGFFELCRVVVINFALLWAAFRSSSKKGAALKIAGTVLVLETILFDLIAGAKLFMYIDAHAFTPLRIQSGWLIIVLFVASVCILISMLSGKKTARFWFIFSAVSMALLALI